MTPYQHPAVVMLDEVLFYEIINCFFQTERPSERPSSGSKAEIPSKKVRHEVPPPTAPPAAHSVPQHRYPVYEPPAVDQAPFEPPTTPVRQTHDNDHNNDVSYPVKYQPPARVSNLVQRQQPPPVQQQPPMRHAPPPEPVAPPHDKMSGLNLQDFAKVHFSTMNYFYCIFVEMYSNKIQEFSVLLLYSLVALFLSLQKYSMTLIQLHIALRACLHTEICLP